ncbi:MAG: thiamine pyrophosphate-dependent enzyme [Candidatus Woesearchaeota archaeon]
MNMKELMYKDSLLASGHRLCPGCGAAIVAKMTLAVSGENTVVANATGCLEVSTTIFPYTSWKVPYIHNAFENAAATISGVVSAYESLKKQGKINKELKFVAFGGDGGTYDIGLQSLSGALERGHKFVYILYDNEAYMNTGIQRSSATPLGAATTTTPVGEIKKGKEQNRKDIVEIIAAHNIPYVAQASIAYFADFFKKLEKAFNVDGPAFINVISPCPLGWGFDSSLTVEMARLAVETNFWPLYEVENGKYVLNYEPKNRLPITEWIKHQARFKHLLLPENKEILEKLQNYVDWHFEMIKKKTQL